MKFLIVGAFIALLVGALHVPPPLTLPGPVSAYAGMALPSKERIVRHEVPTSSAWNAPRRNTGPLVRFVPMGRAVTLAYAGRPVGHPVQVGRNGGPVGHPALIGRPGNYVGRPALVGRPGGPVGRPYPTGYGYQMLVR